MNDWLTVAEGVRRRITVDGAQLMITEVEFEAGAVGALHHHPHEQATFIVRGRVRFTIEDQEYDLSAGRTIHIPSMKRHGVVAIEPSLLMDVFSPPREDFR